ncbi:MAG: hypothetical protein WA771_14125 [Chthoniobacterales bacterium]
MTTPLRSLFAFAAVALLTATSLTADDDAKPAGVDVILGQWLRPDGGYVIDVKSIAEDGKADAVYLNPQPINVESAVVRETVKGITLDLVLRDENYPGATYDLVYDAEADKLKGAYTQPAVNQTFEIEFVRKSDTPTAE